MGSWSKTADIGEIQILRDEKAPGTLCRFPDVLIILSGQSLLIDRIRFVAELHQNADQPERQVFIQFDLHEMLGVLGTGISSSAEVAAKAMTARISSSLRVGKSLRIS